MITSGTNLSPISCHILHLPDEVLSRILGLVLTSCPNLTRIRDALCLASTCRRLYSLFPPLLRTIDLLFPETFEQPLRHPLSENALNSILRIASSHLRYLRLPSSEARIDPSVIEIAFQNIRELHIATHHCTFDFVKHTPNLSFLHLHDGPDHHIKSVALAPQLCQLSITSLQPSHLTFLPTILQRHGPTLHRLSISLHDSVVQSSVTDQFPVKQLVHTTHLVSYLLQLMPRMKCLHHLDIGMASPMRTRDYRGYSAPPECFTEKVARIYQQIERVSCMKNMFPDSNLVHLGLKVCQNVENRVLNLFSPFISASTSVEIQFPGAGLVVTPQRQLLFTRLQMGTGSLARLGQSIRNNKSLHTLQLGNEYMPATFAETRQVRELVSNLCGPQLRTVIANFSLLETTPWDVMVYVGHVMHKAQNVTTLEISCDFVSYFASNGGRVNAFHGMMLGWKSLHVLKLTSERHHFSLEWRQRRHWSSLMSGLVRFLELLPEKCPNLRYLCLGAITFCDVDFGGEDNLCKVLHDMLNAVRRFETRMENVDVSSLKAQLHRWSRSCKQREDVKMINA